MVTLDATSETTIAVIPTGLDIRRDMIDSTRLNVQCLQRTRLQDRQSPAKRTFDCDQIAMRELCKRSTENHVHVRRAPPPVILAQLARDASRRLPDEQGRIRSAGTAGQRQ
jgi:hypothetical protein